MIILFLLIERISQKVFFYSWMYEDKADNIENSQTQSITHTITKYIFFAFLITMIIAVAAKGEDSRRKFFQYVTSQSSPKRTKERLKKKTIMALKESEAKRVLAIAKKPRSFFTIRVTKTTCKNFPKNSTMATLSMARFF